MAKPVVTRPFFGIEKHVISLSRKVFIRRKAPITEHRPDSVSRCLREAIDT